MTSQILLMLFIIRNDKIKSGLCVYFSGSFNIIFGLARWLAQFWAHLKVIIKVHDIERRVTLGCIQLKHV